MSNSQTSPLPFLYVTNLQVARASATTLTVAAGQARDSTNVLDMVLAASTTLDAATNGANGLDAGALANATWYAVHIISSSLNERKTATLLSTSATAPTMPPGYDTFRRIGWVLTDGSAEFLAVDIYGNGNERVYKWDAIVTELNAVGNTSYTDVDMASSVAPTANLVDLNWKLVPQAAGNISLLRKNGSSATANPQLIASVVSVAGSGSITMNCDDDQIIEYKTAHADDDLTLYVVGFTDFI